jgi:mono/diheme cytochrome c family protein
VDSTEGYAPRRTAHLIQITFPLRGAPDNGSKPSPEHPLPRHSSFFPAAALALAASLAAPGAGAGDAVRGRALYESHCVSCHSQSVHGRAKREAKDFEGVRAWVARWNASLACAGAPRRSRT